MEIVKNEFDNGDITNQQMKLKNWICSFLLLLIPIANIVLVFVWAFGKDVNKSKKTFFQAQLIFAAVSIVFYAIIFFAFYSSIMESMNI